MFMSVDVVNSLWENYSNRIIQQEDNDDVILLVFPALTGFHNISTCYLCRDIWNVLFILTKHWKEHMDQYSNTKEHNIALKIAKRK